MNLYQHVAPTIKIHAYCFKFRHGHWDIPKWYNFLIYIISATTFRQLHKLLLVYPSFIFIIYKLWHMNPIRYDSKSIQHSCMCLPYFAHETLPIYITKWDRWILIPFYTKWLIFFVKLIIKWNWGIIFPICMRPHVALIDFSINC